MKMLILLLIFIITGCTDEEIVNKVYDENNENEIVEEVYIDDNPIEVGLYNNNKLVDTYSAKLANFTDIGVFDVYFTNDSSVSGTGTKDIFKKYYQEYENIEKYNIGFYINFYVGDKFYEDWILDPSGTYSLSPYLFVYLYDDVNQPDGVWYSHLQEADVTDETFYSSLKLFLGNNGSEITSPITFMVFTYDEDDFDEENKYIGDSKYLIDINFN